MYSSISIISVVRFADLWHYPDGSPAIKENHGAFTAERAARLYGRSGYAAYLVEEHHEQKRDAPSGTARTLAAIVEKETGRRLRAAFR